MLYFMTDDASHHLSGHMNSQNSTDNPTMFHEERLYGLKVGVWCAVSGSWIVGPTFSTALTILCNFFE